MNNANNKPKPIKPSISSPLKNKRLLSTFYMIGRTKNFVNDIIFYYTFIKICQINRILNKKPRNFRPRNTSLLRTTRKAQPPPNSLNFLPQEPTLVPQLLADKQKYQHLRKGPLPIPFSSPYRVLSGSRSITLYIDYKPFNRFVKHAIGAQNSNKKPPIGGFFCIKF